VVQGGDRSVVAVQSGGLVTAPKNQVRVWMSKNQVRVWRV
jgi:hypothetical protein